MKISYDIAVMKWCLAHLPAIGDMLDLLDIPFGTSCTIQGVAAGTHAYLFVGTHEGHTMRLREARIVLLNDGLQSRHISIK